MHCPRCNRSAIDCIALTGEVILLLLQYENLDPIQALQSAIREIEMTNREIGCLPKRPYS